MFYLFEYGLEKEKEDSVLYNMNFINKEGSIRYIYK